MGPSLRNQGPSWVPQVLQMKGEPEEIWPEPGGAKMCRRALLDEDGDLVLRRKASKGPAEVSQPLEREWRNKSHLGTLLGMRLKWGLKVPVLLKPAWLLLLFGGFISLLSCLKIYRSLLRNSSCHTRAKEKEKGLVPRWAGALKEQPLLLGPTRQEQWGSGWESPRDDALADQDLLVPILPPTSEISFQS